MIWIGHLKWQPMEINENYPMLKLTEAHCKTSKIIQIYSNVSFVKEFPSHDISICRILISAKKSMVCGLKGPRSSKHIEQKAQHGKSGILIGLAVS